MVSTIGWVRRGSDVGFKSGIHDVFNGRIEIVYMCLDVVVVRFVITR